MPVATDDGVAATAREVRVIDLGVRPYVEVLELQRRLSKQLREERFDYDLLLLVEHEPVVTLGRSSDRAHLVVSEEWLRERGVDVVEIERGGDITYHGPGQLVGYPILDLHAYRLDLHWYLRRLEETLLRVLHEFGLPAFRVEDHTGVWTGDPGDAIADFRNDGFATLASPSSRKLISEGAIRKVASIGVHASRWITRHGFALNVSEEPLEHFPWIVPCGIDGVEMTSIAREGVVKSMAQTREAVWRGFDAALAPARVTLGSDPDLTP